MYIFIKGRYGLFVSLSVYNFCTCVSYAWKSSMVLKFEIRQKFKPVFFEKLLYLQTARLLFHKICLVAQYTEYIHAYIFAKKRASESDCRYLSSRIIWLFNRRIIAIIVLLLYLFLLLLE